MMATGMKELGFGDIMPNDAAHFSDLAARCRELARTARDAVTARLLVAMADDFEQEAFRLAEGGNDRIGS